MAALQTVQSIYNYVLSFVDLDSVDVSATLGQSWIQEAFDDLIGDDIRWPFYEVGGQTPNNYTITTSDGLQTYELPTVPDLYNDFMCTLDVKKVLAVQGPHWELLYHSQYALESTFTPAFIVSQEPERWSYWGLNGITLWPIPNATYTLNIRAYREPSDFITLGGMGATIDAPGDFHTAIQQYVLANAWSQQSDLQQAAYWMQNYLAAKQRLHAKYLRSPLPENLAMNRGKVTRDLPPRLRFPFEGLNSVGLGE